MGGIVKSVVKAVSTVAKVVRIGKFLSSINPFVALGVFVAQLCKPAVVAQKNYAQMGLVIEFFRFFSANLFLIFCFF